MKRRREYKNRKDNTQTMPEEDIDLYEDNAGNLFLHPLQSQWVYEIDPLQTGTTFNDDAQALSENEEAARHNWSEEWVHSLAEMLPRLQHAETRLIATWHSYAPVAVRRVTVGRRGAHYLGQDDEDQDV